MKKILVDGNTAASNIAFKFSQVVPVYPITPSTPMAENSSAMSASNKLNIWGETVTMQELQSEAGAAGALHGALLGGALATTFTASQGLLLMVPNMFKIAGEGLPAVFHVSARAIASHSLSIFGDHSDVMATRMTGFSLLSSANVQEAQDMALCAHMLAINHSFPVLHFFDGFRTSHEIQAIEEIDDETLKNLVPANLDNLPFKKNRLNPQNPLMYGTAQNPDVFFQNRQTRETRYNEIIPAYKQIFAKIKEVTGRSYAPFEYVGDKNAENIIVIMGSGSETIKETLLANKISNVGMIKVRVYRPFDQKEFLKVLPKSAKKIAVLDRTIESGSNAPLYLDVASAVQNKGITLLSGRYGLGGKEFNPACVKAIIDNFTKKTKKDFTVGINDDLGNTSLEIPEFTNPLARKEIKIFGLGSDGSVSASKSTVKIIGKKLDGYVQGYFEYDSKKAGSMTVSHIRQSKKPIHSTYLLDGADVIMINNFSFVHRYNCLKGLKQNGVVIMNSIFTADEINAVLPNSYKTQLQEKNATLYVINGNKIANECGLKEKINIIMQTALFKVLKLMPQEVFIEEMTSEVKKNFSKKGQDVVNKNIEAMEKSLSQIQKVETKKFTFKEEKKNQKNFDNEFYQTIISKIEKLEGNQIPVSAFSDNGCIPTDTAKFEKRGIAASLPVWLNDKCIQCGRCVLACPHGAIKVVLVKEEDCPTNEEFKMANALGMPGYKYRLQVSPEDCTGCGVCQNTCIAKEKAIVMDSADKVLDKEKENYALMETLKIETKTPFAPTMTKGLQFKKQYFEFSGACAGCGETPYIKLASMLFGDRMIIANATGCSSIYGGSYPSCPYAKDENGNGPAWANSLFEDNAEFGLGIKLAQKYSGNENPSVWIIGGDGWAFDIGYSGLDHILSTDENVNILVLDNEQYSNTGGQASKATQTGAIAKLAEGGKTNIQKNLGRIAMTYPNAYVAQVAIGADFDQCIKAFVEAEKHNGPSIIIAYSTCVNQGINMSKSLEEMKKAVDAGYWFLYRSSPENGFTLDKGQVSEEYKNFLLGERRFASLADKDSQKANALFERAETNAKYVLSKLEKMKEENK